MKIHIQREKNIVTYEIDTAQETLLNVLTYIKEKIDTTLVFSSGCRSSVCGSCSMRVNDKEVLACAYKLQDGDTITPLKNMPLIRDLVVDMDASYAFNAKAKTWLQTTHKQTALTQEDAKRNALQSDCILCGACYSACPVYSVNEEFLGPFALTRVWRYVSDAREEQHAQKIAHIQTNGVWDCTLCNECTLVCPQDISSKADIEKLRAKSAQFGHIDPSFSNSFGGDFGFDGSPSF